MKLTKQQLKQIIKEEMMNEISTEYDHAASSLKNIKILFEKFSKMRDRLQLEFKRFGYYSSQAGENVESTKAFAEQLIQDYGLSGLENNLIEAVTNGYYNQSVGISER